MYIRQPTEATSYMDKGVEIRTLYTAVDKLKTTGYMSDVDEDVYNTDLTNSGRNLTIEIEP